MESLLRVNVNRKTAIRESVPENYQAVGGRSLIAKILLDEVDPTCEPLGKYNKLIIAPGLLAGTGLSSSGRVSIGGKSPLTKTIKESNSGGILADKLARIGIKAIVIEGFPEGDSWYLVRITPDGCSFISADPFVGLGTYDSCKKILTQFPKAAIACIGPAGEKLYNGSGVAVTDKEGQPVRFSARGGLGALMGSKKIKAVIVEGKESVVVADLDKFKTFRKEYTKLLKDAPSSLVYRKLGTASLLPYINSLQGLPVRNFSHGTFEEADQISGEKLVSNIKKRGGEGKTTHACMPGCVIGCSNNYVNSSGKTIVSSLEYETICLLGSNLGISNLDVIARLNFLCNDIGLDTIETGAAIGIAMEAGVLQFGDDDATVKLMKEIRQGTPLGRVIGNGVEVTARVFGVTNVPAVKGQAMPAYDPRAIKGMGVTYATSAMGADHTAGPTARSPVEHNNSEGQAALSLKMQKLMPVFDCTGLCLFTSGALGSHLDLVVDLINSRFGWNMDKEWFEKLSVQTLKDEQRFNQLAGFTSSHNRLPECFTERSLPESGTVFDVPADDLDHLVKYE